MKPVLSYLIASPFQSGITVHVIMIDGKLHTSLLDKISPSQCCGICGCSPKDINNIDKVMKLSYFTGHFIGWTAIRISYTSCIDKTLSVLFILHTSRQLKNAKQFLFYNFIFYIDF